MARMPIFLCGMMALSKPRLSRARHLQQQGFTLIEIMVVVIVIGVVIGMVTIAVGANDPRTIARKAAEDFMLRTVYLSEQSVLKGETYGFFLEERPLAEVSTEASSEWCYYWRRVRDRNWDALPEFPDDTCLPEGVTIEVMVDERLWKYDPELEFQDPVFGLYPSGDTSGEIEIALFKADAMSAREDDIERITLNLMGELHWITEEDRLGIKRDDRYESSGRRMFR
ncbi:General secretion pathway protein H [Cellvibrio japonicus Ueda107]|uniref:General secretion pathway protein H n=2 Tax=Cellvibrio japonicus TaxID=155077 RepID=B3PF14_CELJU|nr:General secretion pathway protein H [Cellvibrio japonicus Ueda107]